MCSFTCHVFWSKCNDPVNKQHVQISLWCLFPKTRKNPDRNVVPYKNAPPYNHSYSGATKELDHSTIRSNEQQFLRRNQPSSSGARMIDGWGGRIRVPGEHFAYTSLKISPIFNVLRTLTYNEIYRKEIKQLHKFPWKHKPVPQRINVVNSYSSS